MKNNILITNLAYEDLEKALMTDDATPSTFESSGAAGQWIIDLRHW